LIERHTRHPNPRVRLESVRALRFLESAEATALALRVLDEPMDRTLDYALWLTVRELEPYWMPEFQAGKLTFGGDAKKLAFALNAVGTQDAVKPLLALAENDQLSVAQRKALWLMVAKIGGPAE